jgi:hypothetical protein
VKSVRRAGVNSGSKRLAEPRWLPQPHAKRPGTPRGNRVGAVDLAHEKHVDLIHRYRAFQPGFRDEDLPPLPEPRAPRCNGDWWKSMPRSQSSSANERLANMYRGLDFAFRFGLFR